MSNVSWNEHLKTLMVSTEDYSAVASKVGCLKGRPRVPRDEFPTVYCTFIIEFHHIKEQGDI